MCYCDHQLHCDLPETQRVMLALRTLLLALYLEAKVTVHDNEYCLNS